MRAMKNIYGAVRLGLAVLLILLAALAVLVTSLIPGQIRGIPLTAWSVYAVVHLLCFVFGVRITNTDSERMRWHAGLVFPNHTSALDVIVLYYCAPMRFLAAHDVEHRPVIGWIAQKLGTVFVTREDRESRQQAHQQVAEALGTRTRPPVVLFPEGRLGPGYTLFPFRHGAFEIAVQSEIPFLPCAIRYQPLEIALWRAAANGEGMWASVWRLVEHTGPVHVEVMPLPVVHPQTGDSAKQLATEAREAIADALRLPLDVEFPA